jgi:glycosyltransferase involved in cell wall biosynthesis
MFLAVIIPTLGRKQNLSETLHCILTQAEVPDQIIVSATQTSDVPEDLAPDPRVKIMYGSVGSCKQRNRAIDALDPQTQIVCLLDDDVELCQNYFTIVKRFFADRPDVIGFCGSICTTHTMTRRQARDFLRDQQPDDRFLEGPMRLGCAMNLRRSVLDKVRFDERLALYGRLEDADFSAHCVPLGKQGTYMACGVAHLMDIKSRLPGKPYGFCQIMNPFYLWRKGSIPKLTEVLRSHWFVAFASNGWGVLTRKKNRDYWGRLRGNFLALFMILRGRVEPEYIEKI